MFENSETYIAIPPGETIKEQLEDRDMSQKEFARRMGLSEKHVSRLLNGKVGLTHDTALKLESVLGIKAEFWNNLENRYREKLALVKSENEKEFAENLEGARRCLKHGNWLLDNLKILHKNELAKAKSGKEELVYSYLTKLVDDEIPYTQEEFITDVKKYR